MDETPEQSARRWASYPDRDLTKDERTHAMTYRGVLDELDAARAQLAELEKDLERHDAQLPRWERRYVETLNAILSVPGDRESDDDLNRWRGHAEAYRQVCERIRRDAGLPFVRYTSQEWRASNGVREPVSR